jgi:transposase
MPKPYSYDFRQKVIQAIELDGLRKTQAGQMFNISRNTITLWLKGLGGCYKGNFNIGIFSLDFD